MPVQSVHPRLESLLPLVRKPIQYVGGELNSLVKDWDSAEVRWALMYPDAYEVGLPNQGIQILYEVLNERVGVLAERSYCVWPDLEALMREHRIPQFTVDAHRPVRAFDVLGVSFATELGYTNLLTALDLAEIPLSAADRGAADPVVLAGGHAAFNPEPIAEFIDGAVLGDGEQAVLTVTDLIRDWKRAGRPGGRDGLLLRLATDGGVYVPRFYDVSYLPDGTIGGIAVNRPAVPHAVAKHTVSDLDAWPYPNKPVVPVAESVHERFSVEIFRGCTRGCRFCQAGMITRPVRERSITTIGDMVEQGVAASGFGEVGLLSLSSADHSEINDIAKGLADRYEGANLGLSLPSTRVDAFNVTLANEFSRGGRRSGLTFAPEGGTERMRKVINKMVTEEDLIRTVTTAYSSGWRQVKLYFMCGLPTEADEDVVAIADLARKVIKAGREASGRRDIRCTVSIGAFVPKPHTPFQWAAQCGAGAVDRRLAALGGALRSDPGYGRSIGYRYHDGRPSIIEGMLARGDRRVARVIREVWEDGGRFEGWSEYFSYQRWERCAAHALAGEPVDLGWYTTRERGYAEVLPWDHLDAGLDREWLWQDWQDAIDPAGAGEVEDCRWTACYDCGVCPNMGTEIQTGPTGVKLLPVTVVDRPRQRTDTDAERLPLGEPPSGPRGGFGRSGSGVSPGGAVSPRAGTVGRPRMTQRRQGPPGPAPEFTVQRLRVRFAKRGRLRFASHRDVARAVERGVRMADLPVAYSGGFNPRPKLSYGGAVPTCVASEAEYFEVGLTASCAPADVRDRLDAALPPGLDALNVAEVAPGTLAGDLQVSDWQVTLHGVGEDAAELACRDFLAADHIEVERVTAKGVRRVDARAAVLTLELDRRAVHSET